MDEQGQPLTLFSHRLYLSRYFRFEQQAPVGYNKPVCQWQRVRYTRISPAVTPTVLPLSQKLIGKRWPTACDGRFTLISGGPGTETTTVTKLLALLVAQSEQPLLIRLAAPTGKAAARLTESMPKRKLN